MLCAKSFLELVHREGHREGYLEGYDTGFDAGINKAFGITKEEHVFLGKIEADLSSESEREK